jgi:uncharacterized OB-fold protein
LNKKEVKNPCHICGKYSVLYFDYKMWCAKCGSEPLKKYSKDTPKIIDEYTLNKEF